MAVIYIALGLFIIIENDTIQTILDLYFNLGCDFYMSYENA